MLHCPIDRSSLRRNKVGSGFAWTCDLCAGRAVWMPVLRRELTAEAARTLWNTALQSKVDGVQCPSCRRATVRVGIDIEDDEPAPGRLALDVCRACHCVWFDADELERLPKSPPRTPPPSAPRDPAVAQKAAVAEARLLAERRLFESDAPNLSLRTLPAVFGLPIEEGPGLDGFRPWLTWGTAAIVFATSVAAFQSEDLLASLQLVPSRVWDSGGLTAFTSFFVHAGWVHLLSNLWFLVVFGDNVEQRLGRACWLAIVVLSEVLGTAAHWWVFPDSDLPIVGAGGGISGLIACYVLLQPQARLGVFFWLRFRMVWVSFAAVTGLVFWLLQQALLLWLQLTGQGHASALAHLGGVAAGLLVGWAVRRSGGL